MAEFSLCLGGQLMSKIRTNSPHEMERVCSVKKKTKKMHGAVLMEVGSNREMETK